MCKLYPYKSHVEKCCFNKRLSCTNSGDGHITWCDSNKSSRKTGSVRNKLEVDYERPLGSKHGEGLRDRFHQKTMSDEKTSPQSVQHSSAGTDREGNHRTLQKGGSDKDPDLSREWISLNTISRPEEGRWAETGNQSKEPQLICGGSPFQNGGNSHPQKPSREGGLASKNRFKRCLLLHPNLSGTQKIPVLPSRRQTLPVQLSPLRLNFGPMGLYQDPETSDSSRTRAGDAIGSLYRRHSPDGRNTGESSGPGELHNPPTSMPRLHNKYSEDNHRANPNHRFPGIHCKHSDNGVSTPSRENKENPGRVQEAIGGGAGICSRLVQTNRENERGKPGNTTGSVVLQAPPNGDDCSSETVRPGLRDHSRIIPREQGGTDLVGHQNDKLEWEDDHPVRTRSSHRIGRIQTGMGRLLPGHQHRRAVDTGGEQLAHKLPRTASSHPSTEDVRKGTNTPVSSPKNRQHLGGSVHQQPGRNCLQAPGCTDTGSMDVVSRKEHSHSSSVSSGCTKPDSGPRVETYAGQVRLEIGPADIHKDQRSLWSTGSGHVCREAYQPVPSLLQLAARSICRGNGRIPANLDGSEGFCQPPMELNSQGPQESPGTRGRHHPSNSCMENAALVCVASNTAGGLATPPTRAATPQRTVVPHSASRMEHLRESLAGRGLSSQATRLVMESWRAKTNKSYNSLFGRWDRWCSERGSDPFSGPVTDVANFLASMFQEGYQYNSVNAYRSAISSVHEKVDGLAVGQHPLVTRLLKGVFNLRPPTPRYSNTWDVQVVLDYLGRLGNTESLSLKLLSFKTVFLLAITRPSRSADLSQLDVTRVTFGNSGVSFAPTSLAKQSRQGRPVADFYFPPSQIKPCVR